MVVIGGVSYKTSSNKLTKAKTPSTEKESLSTKKLGESFFATCNLQYLKFQTNLQSFCALGKLTKTVNIQGEKFVMDSKGKTLQRIGKGTCMYIKEYLTVVN